MGLKRILEDGELLKRLREVDEDIVDLKQYEKESKNPVVVIGYKEEKKFKKSFNKLVPFQKHIKV